MITEIEEEEDGLERLEKQKNKTLPRINTDTTDRRTGEQVLSLMNTDDADQRKNRTYRGWARMSEDREDCR